MTVRRSFSFGIQHESLRSHQGVMRPPDLEGFQESCPQ